MTGNGGGVGRRLLLAYATVTALSVVASSAVSVTLPSLADDLNLGASAAAWILAAFSVTFPVGTVLFGRIADVAGRRTAWVWGSIMFIGGSAVAALSPWFVVIVAGRLVQGLGAGAIPTLTIARLAGRADHGDRASRVGFVTSVVSIASGGGPLLGGLLASTVHWRAVLALPLLTVAVVRTIHRDLQDVAQRAARVDAVGAILTLGAIGLPLLALRGLDDASTAASLPLAIGGAALWAVLARRIRRRPDGFLRRELLRDRILVTSSVAAFSLLAIYLGAGLAVPLLLAASRGWEPLRIGIAVLPAAVAGVLAARLAPRVLSRHPALGTMTGAALASMAGIALIGLMSSVAGLVAGLALTATGSMGGQVAHTTAVLRDEREASAASAVGTFQLFLFAGGAVGPVVVGTVADATSLRLGVFGLLPFAVLAVCLPWWARLEREGELPGPAG